MKWLPWQSFRHCAISVSLFAALPASADPQQCETRWSRMLFEVAAGLDGSEVVRISQPYAPGVPA